LKVKKGSFVCIIGDVATGKSSLLSTIIGDLRSLESEFVVKNSSNVMDGE
jgi:ABC-type branched-subunit amino acid transport system ATPase component